MVQSYGGNGKGMENMAARGPFRELPEDSNKQLSYGAMDATYDFVSNVNTHHHIIGRSAKSNR